MLEWAAPLWLALVLGLPALVWLHRQREREPEKTVAALFLWPDAERRDAGEAGRRRTDPRWRRRALACALLIGAAAGPLVPSNAGPRIDVHLDDRPSLFARESDGPRLERAVRVLSAAVHEVGAAEVRLLALETERPPLRLDPRASAGWSDAVRAWLAPGATRSPLPARAALPADRTHWLLTDGAHPEAVEWARHSSVSRVLGFGEVSENAALSLLALRAEPEGGGLASLVRVVNAGREIARRSLEVEAGQAPAQRVELVVDPGDAADVFFDWPAEVARAGIRAHLSPEDALPEDDALELDRALPAPARVDLDPRCGPFVASAIAVHPGVELARSEGGAEIRLWCGDDAPPDAPEPTVWWSPAAASAPDRGGRVVRLDGDPADAEPAATPEFAARLAAALDAAAGRPLLDRRGVGALDGGPDAARIAPAALADAARSRPGPPAAPAPRDASSILLWLALAAVVVDSALGARGR